MRERVVPHEIRLQKSVIVILAALAISVFANAFAPVFRVKDAVAELKNFSTLYPRIGLTVFAPFCGRGKPPRPQRIFQSCTSLTN